jgi:hypothetical protein
MYKNKYLKYKTKYLNQKAGYYLSDISDDNFLLKICLDHFNSYEDYKLFENSLINKPDKSQNNIEYLKNFLNSENHKKLYNKLINIYLTDHTKKNTEKNVYKKTINEYEEYNNTFDVINYHIQFGALMFINLLLGLEFFALEYYNKQYDINRTDCNSYIIYNNIKYCYIYNFEKISNIADVFKYFAKVLDELYDNFIDQLIEKIANKLFTNSESILNLIFKNSNKTKLIYNWKTIIRQLNSNININNIIKNILSDMFEYSDNIESFMPFVFTYPLYNYMKYSGNCVCQTLLECYLLSRIHTPINLINISLESNIFLESNDYKIALEDLYYAKLYKFIVSHYSINFDFSSMKIERRSIDDYHKIIINYKENKKLFAKYLLYVVMGMNSAINETKYLHNLNEIRNSKIKNSEEEKKIFNEKKKLDDFIKDKIDYLNNEFKQTTDEEIISLIKSNSNNLEYLFKYILNEEIIKNVYYLYLVVKLNYLALKYIKHEQQTTLMVLIAVLQNGLALEFISEELKKDIVITTVAIIQNNLAYKYIHKNFENDMMLLSIASIQNPNIKLSDEKKKLYEEFKNKNNDIFYILNNIKSLNFFKLFSTIMNNKYIIIMFIMSTTSILLQDIINLLELEDEYKILIILQLFKNNNKSNIIINDNLNIILKKGKNYALGYVCYNSLLYKYLLKTMKEDIEIVNYAVIENGLMLEHVDDKFKNNKLIVSNAVKQNGLALKYVNEDIKNNDIILLAVEQNGIAFKYVNIDYPDYLHIITEALKINYLVYYNIDEDKREIESIKKIYDNINKLETESIKKIYHDIDKNYIIYKLNFEFIKTNFIHNRYITNESIEDLYLKIIKYEPSFFINIIKKSVNLSINYNTKYSEDIFLAALSDYNVDICDYIKDEINKSNNNLINKNFILKLIKYKVFPNFIIVLTKIKDLSNSINMEIITRYIINDGFNIKYLDNYKNDTQYLYICSIAFISVYNKFYKLDLINQLTELKKYIDNKIWITFKNKFRNLNPDLIKLFI